MSLTLFNFTNTKLKKVWK